MSLPISLFLTGTTPIRAFSPPLIFTNKSCKYGHSTNPQVFKSFIMYIGGRIGIYGGDINRIVDDMKALRPTIASFVPRLLNKLYERINGAAQEGSFLKRFLFKTALKVKPLSFAKKSSDEIKTFVEGAAPL